MSGRIFFERFMLSEHDSGVELQHARRTAGGGDLAEARGRSVDIGSGEDHPVEWVERVGLECQLYAFTDWGLAPQAHALGESVRVVKSEHVCPRRVSVRVRSRGHERVLVQERG